MIKRKKSILTVISILAILCFAIGVWLTVPKTVAAAEGETITVSDNFGSENLSASDVYASNHVYASASSSWGMIVADGWGEPPVNPGGTGYVTYKVSPDIMYSLGNVTLDIKGYVTHCQGLYWYNSSRMASGKDELGANITVYVSNDNTSYRFGTLLTTAELL